MCRDKGGRPSSSPLFTSASLRSPAGPFDEPAALECVTLPLGTGLPLLSPVEEASDFWNKMLQMKAGVSYTFYLPCHVGFPALTAC